MRGWALFWLLGLIVLSPQLNAEANCQDCYALGVRVTLKDGEVLRGYLRWQRSAYHALLAKPPTEIATVVPRQRELLTTLESSDEVAKVFWLSLINTMLDKNPAALPRIMLYTKFHAFAKPYPFYAALDEDRRILSPQDISAIRRDETMTLQANLSTLLILRQQELERLRTKKPFMVFEYATDSNVHQWIIYGARLSQVQVQDHIIHHHWLDLVSGIGDLRLDGAPYTGHQRTFSAIRSDYSTLRREYVQRMLKIFRQHRKEFGDGAEFERAVQTALAPWRRQFVTEMETNIRRYARSLGDDEQLRALGVYHLDFASSRDGVGN